MRTCMAGVLLALVVATGASAQQVADPAVDITVARPAFAASAGPVIAIDGRHRNFHTLNGRYAPFAAVLRADGFNVRDMAAPFSADSLASVAVLVIANAAPPEGADPAADPQQSAFSPEEIAAVKGWVERGGALFLIADHMPFAGAAADLAKAFGFTFANGYVSIPREGPLPDLFGPGGAVLVADPVLQGMEPEDRVSVVGTFTGSAFTPPPGARPILVLPPGSRLLTPDAAGVISNEGPGRDVGGALQGAVMRVGEGRLAVFGEAAMFSAQLAGPERLPIGFNNPRAPDNKQLLLNLVHWLAGALPD